MKHKKNATKFFAILLATLTLTLSGCTPANPYASDERYQIYLKSGYEGTYEEWLASIKGEQGPKGDTGGKGDAGKSAYELYCETHPDYEGTEEEWLDDLINGRLGNKEVHTVTFDSNGGGEVESQYIYHGEKIIKPNVSREGYTLSGWYIDSEKWVFNGYSVTYDMTLTAEWKANIYQVSFNLGDSDEVISPRSYFYDEEISLPIPKSIVGFDFLGWKYGNEYITDGPWNITDDITLIADWEKGSYFIYYDFNYDGIEEQQKVIYDEEYELIVPTRKGYTFNGWYLDSELYNKTEIWLNEANLTLVASWTVNSYTITVDLNGGTLVDPSSPLIYTINYGGIYSLPIINSPIDSPFTGWYYQGTRLTDEMGVPYEQYLIDEDITVTAEFFIPITNRNGLENIRNDLSGSYQLMNDIDLSGADWAPINYFEGNFDGQNFTISGMTITTNYESVGLFGSIGSATVSNLIMTESTIAFISRVDYEYIYAGTLIGSTISKKQIVLNNIVIDNSYFDIVFRGKNHLYTGGLVGYSSSSLIIKNTYNEGNFSGKDYIGGLVGYSSSSLTIENSYNTGTVSGSGAYIGGLVGYSSYSSLTIENSYNTGTVSGNAVGGLVGYFFHSSLTIKNAYNEGNISGKNSVGGLVGKGYDFSSLMIENSYNIGTVSGSGVDIGGLVGHSSSSTYSFSLAIKNSYNTGIVSGGTENIGGLVGYSYSSSFSSAVIKNSYNTGTVSGSGVKIGGLAGQSSAPIENSYNTGTVSGGKDYIGGLVGASYSSAIKNSYNTGTVSGSGVKIGGLVGASYSYTIENSYNEGNVSGKSSIGGLVGYSSSSSVIENSYNEGNVSGTDGVGGLVGYPTSTDIFNSINFGLVTGKINVGGLVGENKDSIVMVYNSYFTSLILDSKGNSFENPTQGGTYVSVFEINKDFFINILGWAEEVWDFTYLDINNNSFPKLKDNINN